MEREKYTKENKTLKINAVLTKTLRVTTADISTW